MTVTLLWLFLSIVGSGKGLIEKVPLGTKSLQIEIADNDSLRTLGLSNRTQLAWDRGMLFVFPDVDERAFWMIDCNFDLDIAYIDLRGRIRDIQTMVIEPGVPPARLRRYPSATTDIAYALEVNRGWFMDHKLKVGDSLPWVRKFHSVR